MRMIPISVNNVRKRTFKMHLIKKLIFVFVFFVSSAFADEIDDLKKIIEEQRAVIDSLSERVEAVEQKSEEAVELADAAATAAESGSSSGWWNKTSLGGYGEIHYEGHSTDKIDFHRYVLFVSHEFNEYARFNSEFEIEHSFVKDGDGELEMEQGYIEHEWAQFGIDNTTAKYGMFLIPCGITNEKHEPPTFYGVERNEVEKEVCANTWWEAGLQLTHNIPEQGLAITAGYHSSLTNSGGDIRSGRDKLENASAKVFSWSGKVKYTGMPNLDAGFFWSYQPDMGDDQIGPEVTGTLLGLYADYQQKEGFSGRAFWGEWNLDCPAYSGSGNTCIQKGFDEQYGYLGELSYRWDLAGDSSIGTFIRYGVRDDNAGTLSGTNVHNKIKQWDTGINYWITDDAVLKIDFEEQTKDKANQRDSRGMNVGMGYQF